MTRMHATSYHGRHRRDHSGPREPAARRPGDGRPAGAPAYYLGRPASLWLAVMNPRAGIHVAGLTSGN